MDYWIKKKARQPRKSYSINRHNIYILPSKAGWLYIITLIAILSGAINYNNSPAYLLCFFLASLGFITMLQTHQNISQLIIYAEHSAPVFCHSPVDFIFHVTSDDNNRHIALETKANNNVFAVKGREKSQFIISEISNKRGLQYVSRFKLYSEYPLGLFHAWTQVEIINSAIIYPRPAPHNLMPTDFFAGEQQQSRHIGDDEFAGIRDFQKGDSPKSLAWKTIAKTNRLYTKEFHAETGDFLIFDYDKLTAINNTEERLSILCALVLKASQSAINYGLKLPAKTIKPSSGEAHKHKCLSSLALAKL